MVSWKFSCPQIQAMHPAATASPSVHVTAAQRREEGALKQSHATRNELWDSASRLRAGGGFDWLSSLSWKYPAMGWTLTHVCVCVCVNTNLVGTSSSHGDQNRVLMRQNIISSPISFPGRRILCHSPLHLIQMHTVPFSGWMRCNHSNTDTSVSLSDDLNNCTTQHHLQSETQEGWR